MVFGFDEATLLGQDTLIARVLEKYRTRQTDANVQLPLMRVRSLFEPRRPEAPTFALKESLTAENQFPLALFSAILANLAMGRGIFKSKLGEFLLEWLRAAAQQGVTATSARWTLPEHTKYLLQMFASQLHSVPLEAGMAARAEAAFGKLSAGDLLPPGAGLLTPGAGPEEIKNIHTLLVGQLDDKEWLATLSGILADAGSGTGERIELEVNEYAGPFAYLLERLYKSRFRDQALETLRKQACGYLALGLDSYRKPPVIFEPAHVRMILPLFGPEAIPYLQWSTALYLRNLLSNFAQDFHKQVRVQNIKHLDYRAMSEIADLLDDCISLLEAGETLRDPVRLTQSVIEVGDPRKGGKRGMVPQNWKDLQYWMSFAAGISAIYADLRR